MKIHIIGGGPSGLYFAVLMKARDPSHQIQVFERNPAGNTFGWGVVFSRRTMQILEDSDPETAKRMRAVCAEWEDVVIAHKDATLHVGGNHFIGAERIQLLKLLHERCLELGVEVAFEQSIDGLESLRDADLVVGADGVNSTVRSELAEHFAPTLRPGSNRYVWLGTHQPFDGLTLTFRPHESGVFIAHSYRYSQDTSTFIVECDEATFAKAGLDQRPESESLQLLEEVFAQDLGGHSLMSNHSRWIQFLLVKNEHWYHENVVILGDACHTAHFSIGSGTKLAMEDSIALADSLNRCGDVARGLEDYQAQRKPVVDSLQDAALSSLEWFEKAHTRMDLEPLPFAMECMTRSNRLDLENVRKRDPQFVAEYEKYVASGGGP